jgi:hypothetical protein
MLISSKYIVSLATLVALIAVVLPSHSPALAPAPEKPGLTGKVTFEGDKPDLDKLNKQLRDIMAAKDEAHCLAKEATDEEKSQQAWKIDDKGGVAHVFVWIAPKKGKFFKVDMDARTWPKEVQLKIPHCAFVPHCFLLFPKVRDEKGKLISTGQKFYVSNNSDIVHNVRVEGCANVMLAAKAKPYEIEVDPSAEPTYIICNIHNWMSAYVLALDHPFAAITGRDGTFKIENAPVGEEVRIFAWHEEAGYLNEGGAQGEEIKLEAATLKNFKCKAK